jgi:hypothetical protein
MKFIPNASFRFASSTESDPKWLARLRTDNPARAQTSGTIDLHAWAAVIRQFGAWLLAYSIVLPPLLLLVFMQSMEAEESALLVILNVLLLVVGLAVYCIGTVLERWNEDESGHQNTAAWHF